MGGTGHSTTSVKFCHAKRKDSDRVTDGPRTAAPTIAAVQHVNEQVEALSGRRIGLFGGTFDPPHVGHLVTAVNVRHALRLDEIILMVANEPWQKVGSRPLSSAAARLAMVEAAVADVPGVVAGRHEIDHGGPSFTADTLSALAQAHSGATGKPFAPLAQFP